MSNFAYTQTKISEYLSFIFAILGICSAGIATEMNYKYNDDGSKEDWIKIMLIVANVSTIPLCKNKLRLICDSDICCCEQILVCEMDEN